MAKPRKTVVCDIADVVDPDLDVIEALARLALVLRRRGVDLRVSHASGELRELLAFTGLDDALGVEPGREALAVEPGGEALGVEPGGESEEREQRLGVEEERELPDAAG